MYQSRTAQLQSQGIYLLLLICFKHICGERKTLDGNILPEHQVKKLNYFF